MAETFIRLILEKDKWAQTYSNTHTLARDKNFIYIDEKQKEP